MIPSFLIMINRNFLLILVILSFNKANCRNVGGEESEETTIKDEKSSKITPTEQGEDEENTLETLTDSLEKEISKVFQFTTQDLNLMNDPQEPMDLDNKISAMNHCHPKDLSCLHRLEEIFEEVEKEASEKIGEIQEEISESIGDAVIQIKNEAIEGLSEKLGKSNKSIIDNDNVDSSINDSTPQNESDMDPEEEISLTDDDEDTDDVNSDNVDENSNILPDKTVLDPVDPAQPRSDNENMDRMSPPFEILVNEEDLLPEDIAHSKEEEKEVKSEDDNSGLINKLLNFFS